MSTVFSTVGIGEDSERTDKSIHRVLEQLAKNVPKQDTLNTLTEVFEEACQPGWDGHDGAACSWETYAAAKRFVQMLPNGLQMPDVAAAPEGQISFEWHGKRGWVFWVLIETEFLHYFGRFGASRTRGAEPFGDIIPKTVIEGIKRVSA